MNLKEIKEIIKMLNGTDIADFSLESEGLRLRLRKQAAFVDSNAGAAAASVPKAAPVAPSGEVAAPVGGAEREQEDNNITIVAPMVGTFYRASAPDAPPYVNVGDEVDVGQALCIIEAMKLMNEIESEAKGRVVRILAENGEPVEYGQPLFLIDPS